MADLTQAEVEVLDVWTEGGVNGKRLVVKRVKLTLTAQGDDTDKITAEALRMNRIIDASNGVMGGDTVIPVAVSEAGDYLLALDSSGDPLTGDLVLLVRGYSAL